MIHCPEIRTPYPDLPPEETRLDVFLPLLLLQENASLAPFFAMVVQQFAEKIATITVKRWDRANDLHHGGVVNDPPIPPTPSEQRSAKELVPFSTNPHYVFYRRPAGELEALIAQLSPLHTPPSSTAQLTQSGAGSSSHSLKGSTTNAKREIIHVSPPGMPHLKVAYATDDPWTLQDALAWAEMWETVPEPKSSSGRESGAMTQVTQKLQARIDDLQSVIRARDDMIEQLWGILSDDGEFLRYSPPSTSLNRVLR